MNSSFIQNSFCHWPSSWSDVMFQSAQTCF